MIEAYFLIDGVKGRQVYKTTESLRKSLRRLKPNEEFIGAINLTTLEKVVV